VVGFSSPFSKVTAGAAGLSQLMAGSRKFAVKFIERGDIMALTREAADVSWIPYVMEADMEEVEKILG